MQAGQVDATYQPPSAQPGESMPGCKPEVSVAPVMHLPEALLWLGVAFAVNAFLAIPVFNSQALFLGQAVSLLVLLLIGWRPALLVSVGAAAGLWWAGHSVAAAAVCLVETAVLGALLHRRIPIVPGMLLFWLVLGAPAAYVVTSISDNLSAQPQPIAVLLRGTSGLLSASLAAVTYQLLIYRVGGARSRRMQHIGLTRQAFALAVTLVMLPAASVSLLILDRSVAILGSDLYERMQRDANEYAALAELYLSQYRKALELLAARHRGAPDAALFEDLEHLQRGMAGFLTMMVADVNGLVLHGAPAQRFQTVLALPEPQRSVADRGYFREARDRDEVVISDGIVGRGFGSDPIVAVSVALTDADGRFRGVAEGSLNLPSLGAVGATRGENSLVVVTDRAGQVVGASPAADTAQPFLPLLSTPTFKLDPAHPVVAIPQLTLEGSQYFLAEAVTSDGWKVYALAPTAIVAQPIERFMFAFIIGLTGLLALGGLISRAFAESITRPLRTLMRQIGDADARRINLPPEQRNSPEIVQVEQALDQARQLNVGFRQQVEQEIADKTRKLLEANQALEALTIEDPLTGLNNRRGLEVGLRAKLAIAAREKLSLTLAMIDIDHFKTINDRFGHATGDECLRQLAGSLQNTFRRRGDLIARFGGEEFTVVIVSESSESQVERLEQFRRHVEAQHFDSIPESMQLTLSIGVHAGVPDSATTAADLIESADKALYVSKRSGRNRLTAA